MALRDFSVCVADAPEPADATAASMGTSKAVAVVDHTRSNRLKRHHALAMQLTMSASSVSDAIRIHIRHVTAVPGSDERATRHLPGLLTGP